MEKNTWLFATLYDGVYPYLGDVTNNPWRQCQDGENSAEGFFTSGLRMPREGLLSMPGWTKYCPGLRWFPTTDQTAIIRLLHRNGQSQSAVARAFGVSRQTIRRAELPE